MAFSAQFASWEIWIYQHNLMPGWMASMDIWEKQSTKINIAQNRRRTHRVCTTLGIKSKWIHELVSWLLNANDRINRWQSAASDADSDCYCPKRLVLVGICGAVQLHRSEA